MKDNDGYYYCTHCRRGGFTAAQMEPLYLCEYADHSKASPVGPSNCCKKCWAEFVARHEFMQRPRNIEYLKRT